MSSLLKRGYAFIGGLTEMDEALKKSDQWSNKWRKSLEEQIPAQNKKIRAKEEQIRALEEQIQAKDEEIQRLQQQIIMLQNDSTQNEDEQLHAAPEPKPKKCSTNNCQDFAVHTEALNDETDTLCQSCAYKCIADYKIYARNLYRGGKFSQPMFSFSENYQELREQIVVVNNETDY